MKNLLAGKRLLITGVMTRSSIAFAAAEAAQEAGADIVLTGFGRAKRLTERAARGLPNPTEVLELDVNSESDLAALVNDLTDRWGVLDGALHAIAYAPPDALGNNFLHTSAESAIVAFRTSAYSLKALGAALRPLLAKSENGGSLVALDFDASVAWPTYDWMGVSKAALEAVSRYLARDLGPVGIRVNLVSLGPLRTAAASGVPGFADLSRTWTVRAPLGWDPSCTRVAAGPICFLFSDLSRAISGEILHVDGGFHAIGTAIGKVDD
jgi:meromycolic acid enoyl-[acyl-carrier-protein] reductase